VAAPVPTVAAANACACARQSCEDLA
jgi:hypothetical protein